jgi:sugar lactone lactonase YvrE
MNKVELVLDAQAILGEGAAWSAERKQLYWVDIQAKKVHCYNPADGSDHVIGLDQQVGTLAPRLKGGLVLAMQKGLYFLDEATGRVELIADPESGLPANRFNDGKCDPAGRFWAGTMSDEEEPNAGSLYRLDPDLRWHKMLDGITVSNGMIWSLDGKTMYYIDTPTMEVSAFDYDLATGMISNRRPVVKISQGDGFPDGMTIDREGMLWVAMWEGWQVNRYDPGSGEKLASIPVPVARVTSVAFGGERLDELYITTARLQLASDELAEQPHAGGLFRVKPGVSGFPAYSFRG